MTAVLLVRIGNPYGVSSARRPYADQMLRDVTRRSLDSYFFDDCLPVDDVLLGELRNRNGGGALVHSYRRAGRISGVDPSSKQSRALLKASVDGDSAIGSGSGQENASNDEDWTLTWSARWYLAIRDCFIGTAECTGTSVFQLKVHWVGAADDKRCWDNRNAPFNRGVRTTSQVATMECRFAGVRLHHRPLTRLDLASGGPPAPALPSIQGNS